MKIRSTMLGLVIFVVIFGGIMASSNLGLWKTESTKIPKKISSGSYTGEFDPGDIRGSYAFSDISKNFNIPLEDLGQAFGIKENVASFKVKELETIYGELEIRTGSVRLFVALYTGLPYEIREESYLPQSAVNILKAKGNLNSEQMAYIEDHAIK